MLINHVCDVKKRFLVYSKESVALLIELYNTGQVAIVLVPLSIHHSMEQGGSEVTQSS